MDGLPHDCRGGYIRGVFGPDLTLPYGFTTVILYCNSTFAAKLYEPYIPCVVH